MNEIPPVDSRKKLLPVMMKASSERIKVSPFSHTSMNFFVVW
jgi:hypothetical protein